jgi:RNA polymerase sigma-70 factor (ECF subfamily)
MNEIDAIDLLKKGNLDGLEPLVEKYYFQAVRTAYLIVQDTDLAEDIVQSAFLSASRKIEQLSSARFGPWFFKSVINAAIKEAKRQNKLIPLDEPEDEFTTHLKDWLIDRQPAPEAIVESQEMHQQIKLALRRLTPDQRGAVVAKYFLDMKEIEISRSLNAPVSSIKWWLHTARRKLRQFLSEEKDPNDSPDSQSSLACEKEKE